MPVTLLKCPTCGVTNDEPCRTKSGKKKSACHANRPFALDVTDAELHAALDKTARKVPSQAEMADAVQGLEGLAAALMQPIYDQKTQVEQFVELMEKHGMTAEQAKPRNVPSSRETLMKKKPSRQTKVCTLYMLFDDAQFSVDVFKVPGGKFIYVDEQTPEANDGTTFNSLTEIFEELHCEYCFFPEGTLVMLAPFDNGEEKIPAEAARIVGDFDWPSKTYCVRVLNPGKGDDGLREITVDQIAEVIARP